MDVGTAVELVVLSRSRIREATAAGVLDSDTLAWVEAAVARTGLPDRLPFIVVGDSIFEAAWRWQQAAPQNLAPSTRLRYMRDVRRLVEDLHNWDIRFDAVTGTDLRGYAERRRHEVSAATWAPEEAALMSFFRFCTEGDDSGWRVFERNPWPRWRTARGERSAVHRPADTVPTLPKFLDDEELAHFLTVGVRGLTPSTGQPLPDNWAVAQPLVPERDVAFVNLVLATGARMTEGRLVLIDEIPTDPGRRPWPSIWMRLGGERAKTKGGEVPFHADVGRLIGAWYRSDVRADMVDRAQPSLLRLRTAGELFVVERTAKQANGVVAWNGTWRGQRRRFTTTTIPRDAAQCAVRINGRRIEPLTIWQGWRSGGLPLSADTFEDILREASVRAAAAPDCPFAEHLKPTLSTDARGRGAGKRRHHRPHAAAHGGRSLDGRA